MFWYRLIERLGRNSLVGTTVHDPAQLPTHLAADEHHADWAGQKGYVATTVGEGCILGVGLTASADDAHLEQAYGVFAAEARDVNPEYAPETVNTDGWAATRNAFQTLFPLIAVVLCFLHGFLKIRDRCRKARTQGLKARRAPACTCSLESSGWWISCCSIQRSVWAFQ